MTVKGVSFPIFQTFILFLSSPVRKLPDPLILNFAVIAFALEDKIASSKKYEVKKNFVCLFTNNVVSSFHVNIRIQKFLKFENKIRKRTYK